MSSSLIVVLFLFALSACFENVLSVDKTEDEVDLSNCQEFRTRADRNINFFNLDYLFNEKLENETFRYKFFIQGDREIYIVLTETDSVQGNSKLFEFGLNTGNPPAAIFKTSQDGSQKVRTEEKLHLSSKIAVPVVLILKEDGEVQLFVSKRPYPLLRFPETSLKPKFISFTTRASVLGQFYFNCAERPLLRADNPTAVGIPDEHAYPVVYISFRINLLARQKSEVKINLHYNMTLHNPATFTDVKSGHNELMKKSTETNFQLPKLEIFSDNLRIAKQDPSYILTIDLANRVRATASEEIKMKCHEGPNKYMYCNLEFGLAERNYYLRYYPTESLVNPTIAKFGDIKVFQAPNSFRTSEIPFKNDIIMNFKFDTTKF